MSCQKRKVEGEDRERSKSNPAKRPCFPSEKLSNQSPSKNTCKYTGQERKKILAILEAEFDKELQAKEDEIVEVQERILKTQRILQYLCYAVVSDFYSREKTITSVASTRQRRIHPAVKKLLSGKGPPGAPEVPLNRTIPTEGTVSSSTSHSSKETEVRDSDILAQVDSPSSTESLSGNEKKVPRYIPPKPKPKPIVGNQSNPVRGGQNKIKTILVVGNLSKWLPPDLRDDSASHKWMVYVRGPKDDPDISSFVSKVRFFLHPSYRPNDVVQIVCPPFHLSRRGWGEFPIRVQVHFSNSLNKPVDIIHNLKLDRTHCGLQTLGSETIAEVWIHRELPRKSSLSEETSKNKNLAIKQETEEDSTDLMIGNSRSETVDSPMHLTSSFSSEKSATEKSSQADVKIKEPIASVGKSISSSTEQSSEVFSSPAPLTSDVVHLRTEPPFETTSSFSSPSITNHDGSGIEDHLPSTSGHASPAVCSTLSQSVFKPTVPNVPLTSSNPQKIQTSPLKPGMQLVKCVDSNGGVRLLQVRSDLLPKILKRGTTTIPATPPPCEGTTAKLTGVALKPQELSQTSASQASSPTSVLLQASVAQFKPKTSVIQAMPCSFGVQVNPQSSKPFITEAQVLPQNFETQVMSTTNVTKVSTSPHAVQVPSPIVSSKVLTSLSPKKELPKVVLTSPLKIQGVNAGVSLPLGVRPMLRLVRPAGNTCGNPTLGASNHVSQQVIRLPASVANNGSRPLLVLKDGKLFMMKSALSAGTIKTSISASSFNTSGSSESVGGLPSSESLAQDKSAISNNVVKTAVAQSTDPISVVSSSAKGLHLDSPAAKNSTKPEPENFDTNDTNVRHVQPSVVASTQAEVMKPLVASVSSSVSLLSPKALLGETHNSHTSSGTNVLLSHSSALPQKVLPVVSSLRPGVKAGKSLLKPTVSLLKPSIAASTSASKLMTASAVQSLLKPPSLPTASLTSLTMTEAVTKNKRIILGRTSGPSCITSTSQQALFYRELLGSAVRACPKVSRDKHWQAVRWMVKNLPLINPEAKNLEFKILHPYCAPDDKVFCSWNIGKQRACEWLRAKTVQTLLKEVGWNTEYLWTVREIVLWARFHGYTPGLPFMRNSQSKSFLCDGECENPIASVCKYGKISFVEEWLTEADKSLSQFPLSHNLNVPVSAEECDEEIDIISSTCSPSKVKIERELTSMKADEKDDIMCLNPTLHPLADMVSETVRSVGLSFSKEEILPGVYFPAAHRVLIQAVHSLVEDLTRRAYADAWGKDNIIRRPNSIDSSNVCRALCHRPEFDIFTCAGLGVESLSDS